MGIKRVSESGIQKTIIDYLHALGSVVIRVNGGAVRLPGVRPRLVRFNRTARGTCSDLLVCYKGLFFALEVKVPGKEATDGQSEFLEAVREAGGVGAVVTCTQDVDRVLDDTTRG